MAPEKEAKSSWTAESDRALLLTIIDTNNLNKMDWPAISAKMREKRYTFTHEACRQHYQKLRKEFRGGATPSKPRTPKANSGTPNKTTSQSFATDNSSFAAQGDDDEFEIPSPSKRKRTKIEGQENGQTAPLFKFEHMNSHAIDLNQDYLYEA